MRRKMLGMSQERLGEQLGITFQQIQKYEKGTNRIGASRLQQLATVLDVPVSYFFPETDGTEMPGLREDGAGDFVMEFLSTSEGLELNRAFARIRDAKVRRKVIDLVRSLGDQDSH
ncbi:helix-turn-helix domain-containing protein [Propylenella binzhouense]|uniref:XRE family transcriptional regulator n=1 Tax=Propylenella binzhouense TaxID=2555902 RepID=A0A964T2U8_9HYPH|nr:XRE family transcriptional regulator [Propylenella binzhouense]